MDPLSHEGLQKHLDNAKFLGEFGGFKYAVERHCAKQWLHVTQALLDKVFALEAEVEELKK